MSLDADRRRYEAAAHAMQSGVATSMNFDGAGTEPKHLRVGINAAMSDQCGLAKLLIAKNVFTEAEYVAALADAMEAEARRYEAELTRRLGRPVSLA